MFTIRFMTEQYAPGQTVTLRWAPNWDLERGGVFKGGAWTFDLDEAAFPNGIEFKFVLTPARWMLGQNLFSHELIWLVCMTTWHRKSPFSPLKPWSRKTGSSRNVSSSATLIPITNTT